MVYQLPITSYKILMIDKTPQVFISYSWTSKEYQEKVISLAARLRYDGVDVKLDVWDLRDGHDKYAYMEQCVNNPDIDKVLILSDRVYTEKANERKGGVGDETTIISAELYGKTEQQKFIPVVMETNSEGEPYLPTYLKSKLYRNLSDNDSFEDEYRELLRTIFDAPSHRKPEIGTPPTWLTIDTPNMLFALEEAEKELNLIRPSKSKKVAAKEFLDTYIEALKHFFREQPTIESYLQDFKEIKENRDIFLNHLKAISSLEDFGIVLAEEFEHLQNKLVDIKTFDQDNLSFSNDSFDIFRTHIWELFICSVAFMLHYEMYKDINELLMHTYFLRKPGVSNGFIPICYSGLYFKSRMIEDIIKPTMGKELSLKFSLTGHFICNEREYGSIYSGKNIANADLFLHQVYKGLESNEDIWRFPWFPALYVYSGDESLVWEKLLSKEYCKRIMPLFGTNSIEEFREKIAKCTTDRDAHYPSCFMSARAILDYVKIEDIASLP